MDVKTVLQPDFLRFIRMSLRNFGIYRNVNQTRWFDHLIFMVNNGLLLLATLVMLITFINRGFYLPNIFSAIVMISLIVASRCIRNHGKELLDDLQILSNQMDLQRRREMKAIDKWTYFGLIMNCLLVMGSLVIYSTLTETFDFVRLMTGLEVDYFVSKRRWLLCEIVFDISMSRFIMVFDACVLFYGAVQSVLCKHAEQMLLIIDLCGNKSSSLLDGHVPIPAIRKMYEKHISVKRKMNDRIGIVPFLFCFTKYMFTVVGISYIILHFKTYSQGFLIGLTLSVCTIRGAIMTYLAFNADRATKALDKVRFEINRLIISPDVNWFGRTMKEERASLGRLIQFEGTLPSYAWGMFEINKEMLLHFFNVAIPMFIIIITSAEQFDFKRK